MLNLWNILIYFFEMNENIQQILEDNDNTFINEINHNKIFKKIS